MPMTWFFWALLAAVAAALTAILAKIGVTAVPSTTATAIRTVVVLFAAWALVFFLGEHKGLTNIPRRSLVFLVLSGLATGVSWLAYFRALQMAPASLVSPIDKLSLPLTIGTRGAVAARAGQLADDCWRDADDGRCPGDLVLESDVILE